MTSLFWGLLDMVTQAEASLPNHFDNLTRNGTFLSHDDVQIVHPMQLLPVEIVGDWDFSNNRNSVFIVNNAEEIKKAFEYIIGS